MYIGSTTSFLERAARHWTLLKRNSHECQNLQKDFNHYGSPFFVFQILSLEKNLEKLFELENKIISELSEKNR